MHHMLSSLQGFCVSSSKRASDRVMYVLLLLLLLRLKLQKSYVYFLTNQCMWRQDETNILIFFTQTRTVGLSEYAFFFFFFTCSLATFSFKLEKSGTRFDYHVYSIRFAMGMTMFEWSCNQFLDCIRCNLRVCISLITETERIIPSSFRIQIGMRLQRIKFSLRVGCVTAWRAHQIPEMTLSFRSPMHIESFSRYLRIAFLRFKK